MRYVEDPNLVALRNLTHGEYDFDDVARWLRRVRKSHKKSRLTVSVRAGWLEVRTDGER